MHISAQAFVLQIYPHMLGICHAGAKKVWSRKGIMALCKKDFTLPSVGRQRVRPSSVTKFPYL